MNATIKSRRLARLDSWPNIRQSSWFQQVKCFTYLSPPYFLTIWLNLFLSRKETIWEKTNLSLNISADIGTAQIYNFKSVYLKNLCNQLCFNNFKELLSILTGQQWNDIGNDYALSSSYAILFGDIYWISLIVIVFYNSNDLITTATTRSAIAITLIITPNSLLLDLFSFKALTRLIIAIMSNTNITI